MIRLSERDNLSEYFYDKLSDSASLDDIWTEFSKTLNMRIGEVFDDYIESEFKKTTIPTERKNAEDGWDYLKNQNALTPAKEQEIGDKLSELDDKESEFKEDMRNKVYGMSSELRSKFFNQRI